VVPGTVHRAVAGGAGAGRLCASQARPTTTATATRIAGSHGDLGSRSRSRVVERRDRRRRTGRRATGGRRPEPCRRTPATGRRARPAAGRPVTVRTLLITLDCRSARRTL